jgi:hypothetical protein
MMKFLTQKRKNPGMETNSDKGSFSPMVKTKKEAKNANITWSKASKGV